MGGAGASTAVQRQRVRVTGTVQGVGFRPFVYREAVELGLSGFVCNDSAGVLIEVEGRPDAVARLCELLRERPPPLARVVDIDATELVPAGHPDGFRILESSSRGSPAAPVSVDTAACADCLAEVDDPADRRFEYPFTNCTNCGPRYTIVLSVPYDRPATTMAGFVMCVACQEEYDNPADRRFHAQPNSCPDCGPRLSFRRTDGTVLAESDNALALAVEGLLAGDLLAIKGLGGYHLATDATNAAAVARLRSRKARDEKPFAVMVADVEAARSLCEVDRLAASALASPQRPIVLMPRRAAEVLRPPGTPAVASAVAPGLPELGLMLPYTPLHHLLMGRARRPLVMTSGNLSDDPIAYLDDDAIERLGPLVDGVLSHDRAIHIRCDDSVVRSTPARLQTLRRSRGYAPEPLALPASARRQVLAVGAELKNTVSVAKGSTLVTSHHIGDLEHLATYQSFLQATGHLCALYGVEPEVVVHDLHPEYLSTKWALELGLETWAVQHHHAHVASCLAEHGRSDRVLGIAFDGLGLGTDGMLWGGEFLVADLEGFERVGHLGPVVMPGGAAAIKQPWRMALAWVATAIGPSEAARIGPRLDDRWPAVLRLIEGGGPSPSTTSAGRLFDAVAALVGLRTTVSYEGQAAIELEALAAGISDDRADAYPVELTRRDAVTVLDPAPLIRAVMDELERGTSRALVAAGFHSGLGFGAARLAARLASDRGVSTVALSGGVFQNSRLTRIVERELIELGLEVLVHERVPPNDGGISVGQAAIAATASSPPRQIVA
jgi:hydrogenase maturation protein HypF